MKICDSRRVMLCNDRPTNVHSTSIEIVAGSHHLEGPIHSYAAEQVHAASGGQNTIDYNKLLISGRFADAIAQPKHTQSPVRVNMKRGDIWLMDHRIFHRGTPVDVTAPGRPELMYCFRASLCPTTGGVPIIDLLNVQECRCVIRKMHRQHLDGSNCCA